MAAANEVAVEAFFAGKSIDFIVGSRPGGGYGTYATLLSRHFGPHLPGNPTLSPRTTGWSRQPDRGELPLQLGAWRHGTAFGARALHGSRDGSR